MLVPDAGVAVGMAMRLRSFPAFMGMLMVLVMDMQVLVVERLVQVFDLAGITGRP